MTRKEHLPRDNEGAALERVALLTAENEQLRRELARRDGPRAADAGKGRSLKMAGAILAAMLIVNGALVALLIREGRPRYANPGTTAHRVQIQAEATRLGVEAMRSPL